MLFSSKHLQWDFHDTRFWVPGLKVSNQVIGTRKYRVTNKDNTITIERRYQSFFDFLGMRALKRYCIAKGKMIDNGNMVHLDLETGLDISLKINLLSYALGIPLALVLGMVTNYWGKALGFGLFLTLCWLFASWVYKRALNGFTTELQQDIEYFKTETGYDL